MSLFDEIRRQIQEAIDEAQGQQRPAPARPQAQPARPKAPPKSAAAPVVAAKALRQPVDRPQRVRRQPPAAASDREALLRSLGDPSQIRQAVLLAELLDRPRALRPFRPR